jgi:ATP/maltotriose-dependent transcriptional regulator MalT
MGKADLMPRDMLIPEQDVRKIVRLLGKVAATRGPAAEQRRTLMNGLAEMIDADAWSWIVSRAADHNDNPAIASFMHAGLTEQQVAAYVRIMQDRKNTPVEYKSLNRLRLTKKRFTRTWDQLVTRKEWYSPRNKQVLDALGFEHLLYSVKILDDDGLFSGICLKRRLGRPNFAPMQRRIAHIVTGEVDWLHEDDKLGEVTLQVRPLPPSHRVVLTLLIEGQSLRQIADKLGRGYYTIKDHTKAIYQHFNVKSRPELFRHFMAGDGQDVN